MILVNSCNNCKLLESCPENEYRLKQRAKGKLLSEIYCNAYIWVNEEEE